MPTLPSPAPLLRWLFVAAALLAFSIARSQDAPSPPAIPTIPDGPGMAPVSIPSIPDRPGTAPATRQGMPSIPKTPWFGDQPLPTDDELKVLQTARDTAERNPDVRIATRTYAERFGAADDLVRTLMFDNPAINDPLYEEQNLVRYKNGQVLHDTIWNVGIYNSPDILLPDPLSAGGPFGDFLTIHMSSGIMVPGPRPALEDVLSHTRPDHVQSVRASYGLDAIHQAALDNANAKIALQKVHDAYQALDAAVRAAMIKDPAVKALLEKYPYLLYGRRDLGFGVASMMIMT